MTKRSNNKISNFPGLFDDLNLNLDNVPSSILSDIARHVAKKQEEASEKSRIPDIPRTNIPSEQPLGPVIVKPVPNRIMFMSLGSGSSGNCAYIGDSRSGFLIDAGVSTDTVIEGLKNHGISMDKIKGICITHDHSDHMRYVYPLLRKNRHMSLYCTPRAMNGIMRRHSVSRRLKDYQRQSDYLMIESNYDLNMLRFGPYPEYLKARIRNVNGHLDNKVTAEYLAKIYTERLKYVFLCHLSHDNNTPDIAIEESRSALEAIGLKVGTGCNTPDDNKAHLQLVALPRFDCSQLYCLRPKSK